MRDLSKGPEVVLNIPAKFKYYLIPLSLLISAMLICLALVFSF